MRDITRVTRQSLVDLTLSLHWQSELAVHEDSHHFAGYNVWRDLDLLPPALNAAIIGQPIGDTARVALDGDLAVQAAGGQQSVQARVADVDLCLPGVGHLPRVPGRHYPRCLEHVTGERPTRRVRAAAGR